jgi:death-on-curing protein
LQGKRIPRQREPTWIDLTVALAIHDAQIAEHRGQAGVPDHSLLESALARPRHQFVYGERSLARLAASYAFGISRNHPFLDGNKRTSMVVAELFLELNGRELVATDAECVTTFLQLAAGDLAEGQLAEWIAAHLAPGASA